MPAGAHVTTRGRDRSFSYLVGGGAWKDKNACIVRCRWNVDIFFLEAFSIALWLGHDRTTIISAIEPFSD
jgi:hypothetical protein